MDVALSACHNYKTECGTKLQTLTTSDITLETALDDQKKSCHWLIKSKCGAPLLKLEETSSLLEIRYVEYQSDYLEPGTDYLEDTKVVPFISTFNQA